jgi:hypothetical protein
VSGRIIRPRCPPRGPHSSFLSPLPPQVPNTIVQDHSFRFSAIPWTAALPTVGMDTGLSFYSPWPTSTSRPYNTGSHTNGMSTMTHVVALPTEGMDPALHVQVSGSIIRPRRPLLFLPWCWNLSFYRPVNLSLHATRRQGELQCGLWSIRIETLIFRVVSLINRVQLIDFLSYEPILGPDTPVSLPRHNTK